MDDPLFRSLVVFAVVAIFGSGIFGYFVYKAIRYAVDWDKKMRAEYEKMLEEKEKKKKDASSTREELVRKPK